MAASLRCGTLLYHDSNARAGMNMAGEHSSRAGKIQACMVIGGWCSDGRCGNINYRVAIAKRRARSI